jgi:mRNA interferase MazF
MIKRFLEWISLKEKIHMYTHQPPFVSVGDIWWASVGDNIGQEINGKGKDFTRPVYVYKKLSHNFYLVIPMTSKIKIGSWYVGICQGGKDVTVCLHQIRVIDHRRLIVRLGEVDEITHGRIKLGFLNLYT